MFIVFKLLVSRFLPTHKPVYVARNNRLQKVLGVHNILVKCLTVCTLHSYSTVCSPACAERLSTRRSLEVQEAMDVVRQKETQLSRLQSSLVRMEVDARTRSRSPSPERQIVHVSQVRHCHDVQM